VISGLFVRCAQFTQLPIRPLYLHCGGHRTTSRRVVSSWEKVSQYNSLGKYHLPS